MLGVGLPLASDPRFLPWTLVPGPFWGKGVPQSLVLGPFLRGRGTPLARTRTGPLPWPGPIQGVPFRLDSTRHGQDTLRAVRLLQSRRRTFLFCYSGKATAAAALLTYFILTKQKNAIIANLDCACCLF